MRETGRGRQGDRERETGKRERETGRGRQAYKKTVARRAEIGE